MKRNILTTLNVVALMGLLAGIVPAVARAEGSCGRNTGIVPDGRITTSVIPANTTFWFNLNPATPGRSYSVEFRSPLDRPPSALFTLVVSTNCLGNPYPGVRNTNTIDPAVQVNTGERRGFTVTPENPVVMFALTNPNNVAMTYTFSDSETTMFGTWTFTHYEKITDYSITRYYLSNTSNAPITVTGIILVGTSVAETVRNTLAPNETRFWYFHGPSLSDGEFTATQFTHDGPPGAIQGDAYYETYFGGQHTQRNIKFEARRECR